MIITRDSRIKQRLRIQIQVCLLFIPLKWQIRLRACTQKKNEHKTQVEMKKQIYYMHIAHAEMTELNAFSQIYHVSTRESIYE